MSDNRIAIPGTFFQTEIDDTLVKLSATSITIASGVATAVVSTHGLSVADWFTWSGITGTGVTGLNGTSYQVVSVTDANTFTFNTALTGTVGGTIILEPLLFPGAGWWYYQGGTNNTIEKNPTNDGYLNDSTSATWRVHAAASTNGVFCTDGSAIRVRHPSAGSAGHCYLSRIG